MGRVADMVRHGLFKSTAQAVAGPSGGVTTIAAAGSSWATATAITSEAVLVTSAQDGTKGVALPASYEVGDEWLIYSKDDSGTSACILFPPSGGKINNGAADATFSITDGKTVRVKAVASGQFLAVLSA